jgi:hypothetical protein
MPVFRLRVIKDIQHDDGDHIPEISELALHEIWCKGESQFSALHEGREASGQGKVLNCYV